MLKNVEILRSGLTTGSQGRLLKHALSSLEVLLLMRQIHNLRKVENGLSGNLRYVTMNNDFEQLISTAHATLSYLRGLVDEPHSSLL